jgi:hypothetical protein
MFAGLTGALDDEAEAEAEAVGAAVAADMLGGVGGEGGQR